MSQNNLPSIIVPGNSYIPLLAVQQRPHSRVYQMPVREHGSAAEATAASMAARARLNPTPRRSLPRPVMPPLPPVYRGDDIAPLNMHAPPSWRFLIALVSARTGVSVADIVGRNRTHAIAAARHEAIALVFAYSNHSLGKIGKMFGGLDHSTIFHVVRKLGAEKLIEPAGSTA